MDISSTIIDASNNTHVMKDTENEMYEQKKQELLEKRKQMMEIKKQEIIKLVCRQTNYTEEEAENLLETNSFNYLKVINDYLGVKPVISNDSSKTTNQMVYGEMRKFLDHGARKFLHQQEQTKKYNEFLERKKQQEENNTKKED